MSLGSVLSNRVAEKNLVWVCANNMKEGVFDRYKHTCIAEMESVKGVFCKRSRAQRSGKFLVKGWEFWAKSLKVMEDHTFSNKSYDNIGLDSYLQPTWTWVLAPVMETGLSQKSRWEERHGPAASNKANSPFQCSLPDSLWGFPYWYPTCMNYFTVWGSIAACILVVLGPFIAWTRLGVGGKGGGASGVLHSAGGACRPHHWCPQSIFNWMILLFLVSRGERSQSVVSLLPNRVTCGWENITLSPPLWVPNPALHLYT